MAEVPEDYDSDPDEGQKRSFRSPESKLEKDAKPQSLADTDSEERRADAEQVLLQPTEIPQMPEEEIPMIDPSSQTQPEAPQVLELETSEEQRAKDLEVSVDKKYEEPDLQPPEEASPDVPVEVLTEPTTGTDGQLPRETKSEVPGATISETRLELPEETRQKIPEQHLGEQDEETGPEQTTPDFSSEKLKLVEETGLPQQEVTKSEITEETQKGTLEEASTEPSPVTKSEFPDQKPRTEEADLKPPAKTNAALPEGMYLQSTEAETEATELIESQFPDKQPRKPTKEKVPEPLEKIKSELPAEESKKIVAKTSPELSGKTSEVPKDTHQKSLERVQEDARRHKKKQEETDVRLIQKIKPVEYSKLADQKEKIKSSEKLRLEGIGTSTKEKDLELQEQAKSDFSKKELRKTTDKTGIVPPHVPTPEGQEKSQTQPTDKRNLESSDEPKPTERHTELPKRVRPEARKFEDEQPQPKYPAKDSSIKDIIKAKKITIGSSRESLESVITEYDSQEFLKVLQTYDTYDEHSNIPSSEVHTELKESTSEKKAEDLSQDKELESKVEEPKARSANLEFKHLKWTAEEVAEWISELGFPQYKECFLTNFINGQKLIYVNCSNLPQMGITDFEDMKEISRHTRNLLGFEEPLFSRSIRLPHRDNIGLFLEQKGHNGVKSDSLTFHEFIEASGLQEYGPEINLDDNKQETPKE